jgi:hypothetical protein
MKKLERLIVLAVIVVLSAGTTPSGGSAIRPGSTISGLPKGPGQRPFLGGELIQNGGFETGSLAPWTTNDWEMSTSSPHQGNYCAADSGDFWIRQDINPMPANWIQRVTFWSRQIASPHNQAYDFIYADSSVEEFAVTPGPSWTQYDVTANLATSKTLVAFRLWGCSSIGGVDSTYIDDISIAPFQDVEIEGVFMPDTDTMYDTTIVPMAEVRNYGPWMDSVWVWFIIEHTCSSYVHRDSEVVVVSPGQSQLVTFNAWTPPYPGLYRWVFALDPNDTNWHYLYILPRVGVDERAEVSCGPASLSARPNIGRAFVLCYSGAVGSSRPLEIYDAAGKLVWRRDLFVQGRSTVEWHGTDLSGVRLPPGVYLARIGPASTRLVLTE